MNPSYELFVLKFLKPCLYDPGTLGSRLVNNLLLFSRLRLYGDLDVPLDRGLG